MAEDTLFHPPFQSLYANLLSVAPMLDWTDRHFRFMMRLICRRALLYTEMIALEAVLRGDREKLLSFSPCETPLVLQIGGSDPFKMKQAAQIAESFGYQGINLNAGCPSDAVQKGGWGACLMKEPETVAECIAALKSASRLPVSVKTRISLQESEQPYEDMRHFALLCAQAGADGLIIHARQAVLKKNFSPKDNRAKLPLDYNAVYRLKEELRTPFPSLPVIINGNITIKDIDTHLPFTDGVMIGRAAYGDPYSFIGADKKYYNDLHPALSREDILRRMIEYARAQRPQKPLYITRHLMGLYKGTPCAGIFRKALMENSLEVLEDFLHRHSNANT